MHVYSWDFLVNSEGRGISYSSAMLLIRIREIVSLLFRKMYLTTFWKAKSILESVCPTGSKADDLLETLFFTLARESWLTLLRVELLWLWMEIL